ncbi:MAG: arginine--tRNA ligase [Oscillospiraceae bacterium]|jgi:arginyl-tRNA synthetase
MNLIEAAKKQIQELILKAYEECVLAGELPAGAQGQGTVEIPKDASFGDYASGFSMSAARSLKMPPRKIAEAIAVRLKLSGSYFSSASVAGAGFINFRLSPKWYGDVLRNIEDEGESYGSVDEGHGKRVMVEFVSANPTGPMTIGNARGGVLGDAMASVLEKAGYDVTREFYINDAGNQVELFGRSVEARLIQLARGEDAVEFPENGYHGEDIKELAADLLSEHGERVLNMPDEERLKFIINYGLNRNIGLMHEHLERYGIKYDVWFPETELHKSGYVEQTVDILTRSGYTYEKDGALWLKNTALGADKDEVLRRSNGYYTYFAVDMAYHRNKFIERGFDKVINVWGADHHGHAIRFKKALPALNIDPDRLDFIIMQLVRLVRDGETVKVSKRTGKAITLNDLLDEISVDAARFFFNAKPDTHLEFDMDLAVRQDSDNPVYYVQYAHARICRLIETLAGDGFRVPKAADVDISLLDTDAEKELIKQLSMLPEEVRLASRDYDPSRINRWLIELASRFHKFYNSNKIRGAEIPVLLARLVLCDAVRETIKNGLSIIGVSAPERM